MAKEKSKGMLEVIKNKIANSGKGFGDIFGLSDGKKAKIRFLSDFEDTVPVNLHDKWGELMPQICFKYLGKKCEYCDRDDIRTRENYVWTIYDYEQKKVLLFMYPATDSSPIPGMISAYETYGTLLDRDYVITRKGSGKDTKYVVMPLDKSKFKNHKARALTEDEIYEKLFGMTNIDLDDLEDLDEDELEDDEELEEDEDVDEDEDEFDEDEDDEDDEEEEDETEDEDEDDYEEDEEEEEVKQKKPSKRRQQKLKRRKNKRRVRTRKAKSK